MNTKKNDGAQSQYAFVLKQLVSREIRRKYARSYLGIIWSILSPLMSMAVISMVFSAMFKRSIENFPIYYLTGHMIWDLFNSATNSTMTALVDNKSLLMKVKLPKQTFILARALTALTNFGYSFVAYVVMLLVFQIKPSWTMLLYPLPVIGTLLFSLGMGYVLSILYVQFADIKHLYSVVLKLWIYLCAIFYPVSSLPEIIQKIVGINPVYVYINFARQCVMYQTVPDPIEWIKMILWSIGVFAFGYWFYKKNENSVMQKL